MDTSLNPFYTKQEVAASCWNFFTETLPSVNRTVSEMFFVEPSAGTGAFYNQMPPLRRLGIDVLPKCENVITQDFFTVSYLPYAPQDTAIVGNPPFGKRGKMAVAFL